MFPEMSTESSTGGLFEFINFASFDNEFSIHSAAFTESRNYIYGFIISDNKRLSFCHIPKHRKEEKLKADGNPTNSSNSTIKGWTCLKALKFDAFLSNLLVALVRAGR